MAGTGVEPTGDSFLQAPKFFEFAIIGRNDRDKNAEAHTVVAIRWARNTLGSQYAGLDNWLSFKNNRQEIYLAFQ